MSSTANIKSEEQTLREQLAACHHIIHFHGWDDLLATHLSARIPHTDYILITPMDVPFEEVTASKLIKCDTEGNVVSTNGQSLMPQAINIHGALYQADSHIMSAMHTHSLNGTCVASLECGYQFLTQESLRFYNDIAYCDYDGLALDNEGQRIVENLNDKAVMLLRNHGLLTTGQSIEEAMYRLYYLEYTCKQQLTILATQQSVVEIPQQVCQKTKAQFDSIKTPEHEFNTLVRRIEGLSRVDYRL